MRLRTRHVIAALAITTQAAVAQFEYSEESGQGPFYEIRRPEYDAEQQAYAAAYFDCESEGNCGALEEFEWVYHVDGQAIPGESPTQAAPFAEAHPTFAYIYRHHLVDDDGNPVMYLRDLIERDRTVGEAWKFYMLHGQIVTIHALDPVAHANHRILMSDGLSGMPELEMRGVVINDPALLVTDRLYIIDWEHYRSVPTSSGLTVGNDDSQDASSAVVDDCCEEALEKIKAWIAANKDTLKKINDWAHNTDGQDPLYKEDEPKTRQNPNGDPGFDCDDFVSAQGNQLQKYVDGDDVLKECDVRITAVMIEFQEKPGGPRTRHAILKITLCGKNFFIDTVTGEASSEPTPEGGDLTKPVSDICGPWGENAKKTVFVDFEYELNDRHGDEPAPFSDDPEEVQRLKDTIEAYNKANNTEINAGEFLPG